MLQPLGLIMDFLNGKVPRLRRKRGVQLNPNQGRPALSGVLAMVMLVSSMAIYRIPGRMVWPESGMYLVADRGDSFSPDEEIVRSPTKVLTRSALGSLMGESLCVRPN